jgi:acetoin utilization deacetylase AcuC-like enzyme
MNGYPDNSGKPLPANRNSTRHLRILNQPLPSNCTHEEFLATWTNILQKMITFQPQLILVSAGENVKLQLS